MLCLSIHLKLKLLGISAYICLYHHHYLIMVLITTVTLYNLKLKCNCHFYQDIHQQWLFLKSCPFCQGVAVYPLHCRTCIIGTTLTVPSWYQCWCILWMNHYIECTVQGSSVVHYELFTHLYWHHTMRGKRKGLPCHLCNALTGHLM